MAWRPPAAGGRLPGESDLAEGRGQDFVQTVRWGPVRLDAYNASRLATGEPSISQISTIAALVSIATSLWLGLALLMGVRSAQQLPARTSQATRLVVGVLTFLVWYAGILSGVGILAALTVRRPRDVASTVLVLFIIAAGAWALRRLVRSVWAPAAHS